MLLKKECGRQLSVLSLCLAVMFAPLLTAEPTSLKLCRLTAPQRQARSRRHCLSRWNSLRQRPSWPGLPLPEGIDVESLSQQLQTGLPAGYTPAYINQLTLLYAARDMKPMWENREAVRAFQQQLAEVAIAGFQPQFTKWVELLTDPAVTGQARDVVLSDAMMGYLQFVAGIPVNGNRWLYSDKPYKLATPALSVINQWQLALDNGDLPRFIASPRRRIHSMPRCTSRSSRWSGTRVHGRKCGDRNAASGSVEQRCASPARDPKRSGILDGGPKIALPGDDPQSAVVSPSAPVKENKATTLSNKPEAYDRELVAAVKQFRAAQGLGADGVIGPSTRDWLNVSPAQRAGVLALNIQRLRLLPGTLSTGIMVNIPAYSLVYYQDGSEKLASRVIVGRPDRKTPMMSSALNNVVVNPPWNVPPTLARKDILPKVWNDPGYLERHGYTVMRGWNSKEAIDPTWLTGRRSRPPTCRSASSRLPERITRWALQIQHAKFRCYLSARYAEPQSVPERYPGTEFRLRARE